MTLTGFSMNTELIAEEFENSETIAFFKSFAISSSIRIVFGVVIRENEKSSNRLILVSEQGDILVNYSKIHPFSYSKEDEYYIKGDKLGYCVHQGNHVGCTICYDLRFPELFQGLSTINDLIITIANWPQKRVEHWKALLKARAIENQSIMVGVNRTGTDGNGIHYENSSCVFDQNGTLLQPILTDNLLEIYDLDINAVKLTRAIFPVKNDRRNELYKTFFND
jgi:predicted amidohydrolase